MSQHPNLLDHSQLVLLIVGVVLMVIVTGSLLINVFNSPVFASCLLDAL